MLTDLPRPKDYRFFTGRLKSIQIALMVFMAVLLMQVVRQSIIQGQRLFDLSENNFLRSEEIDAPRGLITDRNGAVLAYNKSIFNISIQRFRLSLDTLHDTVDRLEDLLGRDLSHMRDGIVGLRRYQSSLAKAENLSLEETLPILERQGDLPGVVISQSSSRFYPESTAFSHFLGYTGIISQRQVERLKVKGYKQSSWIGKTGLEGYYESYLRGSNGRQVVMRDAVGRTREINVEERAEPGKNIETTIDVDLQMKAMEVIAEAEYGAVAIMMDPQNGEVFALASHPSYNLNKPAIGLDSPKKPHWNRAIQEVYPPGSTFKVFTALAALEQGWDPATKVNCTGRMHLGRWAFRCHRSWGHGEIDLEEALKYSCNIYFYTIARRYGEKAILERARRFGLGSRTGIDLPAGEAAGQMKFERKLYPGEELQVAIGNYSGMKVTPLQMITAFCALGNAGDVNEGGFSSPSACRLVRPHLMRRVISAKGEVVHQFDNTTRDIIEIPDAHRRVVINGMWRVVNEKDGTAYWHIDEPIFERRFPIEWDIFGKTATASRGTKENPIEDAWFIALAPRRHPRIAVLVMLERAGSGGEVAAPKAKELLRAYFEKYGYPGEEPPSPAPAVASSPAAGGEQMADSMNVVD